ncbi:MAG: hypothetical protein GY763_01785 [Gammaproteobacteria bacterium]|nr:hypothetical protein [Gammaproteobacteria bacterium]
MKNPLYLTDQELEAWHVRNFGAIPCTDEPIPCTDETMREHCTDLYYMATTPVVHED